MHLCNGLHDPNHLLSAIWMTMAPHVLIQVGIQLVAIYSTHPLVLDLGIFPEALKNKLCFKTSIRIKACENKISITLPRRGLYKPVSRGRQS